MLLRSSSTPILKSWNPLSKDSFSPEPEILHQTPRTRSIVSLSVSSSSSSLMSPIDSAKKLTRALSETDLRDLTAVARKKPMSQFLGRFEEDEEAMELGLGLGFRCCARAVVDQGFNVGSRDFATVLIGGGIGGGGGRITGGGGGGGSGGGGDGDGSWDSWDSNLGNRSTDLYYQKMIEANPGNALLLGNYAKFLKDIQGDFVKAEEYCERAILADPNDPNVLSMYAELIWKSPKDNSRAEDYFDRAVKAAPNDCFVLASYARFLWATEGEEENDSEEETDVISEPNFFNGVPPTPPPLASSS